VSNTPGPFPRVESGQPPASQMRRTILFWVAIVVAVFLWKMATVKENHPGAETLNYTQFMEQVDGQNVSTANFSVSGKTAEISGSLRGSQKAYTTTVPNEVILDFTDRLRKQGVPIEIKGGTSKDPLSAAVNFAPIILLVLFWIFMMRQMNAAKKRTEEK
jgi:ATP-dependent Zn protease